MGLFAKAKENSEIAFAASQCLLENKLYGQANARAYYSVYHWVSHLVSVKGWWPLDERGRPFRSLSHASVPDWSYKALTLAAGAGVRIELVPEVAREMLAELKDARITGDYRGYVKVPEVTARRLLEAARLLRVGLEALVRKPSSW